MTDTQGEPIIGATVLVKGTGIGTATDIDGKFSLDSCRCVGACGLAPVMTIDGEVHAKMTPESALAILEELRRKEAETA